MVETLRSDLGELVHCTISCGVGKATTRSRRPQRRSEETREKLASAAVSVFAERGFAGATTRVIAEQAGVALAALPYHFETKEALWRAAAERLFSTLERELGARARDATALPPRERLERLLGDFVRFAARHPSFTASCFTRGRWREPALRWLVERHVRPLFRGLSAAIREAQSQAWRRRAVPSTSSTLDRRGFDALRGRARVPLAHRQRSGRAGAWKSTWISCCDCLR